MGRLDTLAGQQGDIRSRVGLSIQVGEFVLRAGDVGQAQAALDELELWFGLKEIRLVIARLKALIGALRGEPTEARRWAEVVLDDSTVRYRATWDYLETKRALGLAVLFEGDYPSAVDLFESVWYHCQREGVADPGAFPVAGDLVEALVETRALDWAAEVTNVLERLAVEQQHPWGLATVKRARAMIDLASGENEAAGLALLSAATDYGRLGLEFERARCLLYLGRLQRRSKKWGEARQALEDAADGFARLGCSGWAAKAHGELSRVGGRRPVDETELTPSEQRVVDLAASGLSNKEIATVLYVSVYTVEAHLSHAYAKLGIRSRSQLARRISPG
jgi:DNA-binding CsgD family transcriptional regulator